MRNLRAHVRELQLLENRAAEKAGMRFQLLEEGRLLGKKGRGEYIEGYVRQLLKDIEPEIMAAAKLGRELAGEISGDD